MTSNQGLSEGSNNKSQMIRDRLAVMREVKMKKIKKELGYYSSSLTVGSYPDLNVWYEGGSPERFWLRVNTRALQTMNSFIKVR